MLDGDHDEDFYEAIPFDPARGIAFKTGIGAPPGRGRRGRGHLAPFERAVGARLPDDFVKMIGSYIEGSFDGVHRVYARDGVEVCWDHLMLLGIATDGLPPGWLRPEHDTLRVIAANRELYYGPGGGSGPGGVALLPFGTAYRTAKPRDFAKGHLVFDVARDNAVVFVPTSGTGPRTDVAPSFRATMLASHFLFFG